MASIDRFQTLRGSAPVGQVRTQALSRGPGAAVELFAPIDRVSLSERALRLLRGEEAWDGTPVEGDGRPFEAQLLAGWSEAEVVDAPAASTRRASVVEAEDAEFEDPVSDASRFSGQRFYA